MSIVLQSYQLAKQLPVEEKFGLRTQITKSAVSIPSNIAEGSAKRSSLDYRRFLEMALASSFELETQVLIAEMLAYGETSTRDFLLGAIDEEQKMLLGFIKRLDGDGS